MAAAANIYVRHDADTERYAVREQTRILAASAWGTGGWHNLPAHRIDLGGELEEPLTVQWVGDLARVKQQLLGAGWRVPEPWTARTLAAWLTPAPDPMTLPLTALLQNGRVPALALIYTQQSGSRLVLRLWATVVDVTDDRTSAKLLWIGAVVEERLHHPLSLVTLSAATSDANAPREILAKSIGGGRVVRRTNVPPDKSWNGEVLLLDQH